MKLIDVTKKNFKNLTKSDELLWLKNMVIEINHEKISEKTDN